MLIPSRDRLTESVSVRWDAGAPERIGQMSLGMGLKTVGAKSHSGVGKVVYHASATPAALSSIRSHEPASLEKLDARPAPSHHCWVA